MKILVVLVAILAASFVAAQNDILDNEASSTEFACKEKHESKKEYLPNFWNDEYMVEIELTDWKNNETGELVNLGSNKTGDSGLIKRIPGGKTYQWIFRRNYTFYVEDNGKSCNVSNVTYGSPMNISISILQLQKFNINSTWRGIVDLLGSAQHSTFSWLDTNATDLMVRGIPADHWTGCMLSKDNKTYLQFDVCFSKGPLGGMAGKTPLRVELKTYAAKDEKEKNQIKQRETYEIFFARSNYSLEDAETYFLPPRGVYCDGMANTTNRTYPLLPDKFNVFVEYIDAEKKKIDDIQVSYDGSQKIVEFTFTGGETDVGFAGGLGLGKGRFRVIQDYLYGYQYLMSDGGDKCEKVDEIPTGAGTSVPSEKNNALKNATELLMGARMLNFSYIGQRTLDHGIPADVFLAENKSISTVYEAWFTTSNWTVSTVFSDFNKSVLYLLDIYHTSTTGVASRSSQRFHSFTELNGTSFPMNALDALPCLNKTKDGYIYLELKGSVLVVDKFGEERVKSALREKLASVANVSVVRISQFYLNEISSSDANAEEKKLRLLFVLGDMNKNESTPTEGHKTEISAEEAIKNLKKALAEDIKVTVTDYGRQTMEVTILKQSLDRVPYDFHFAPTNGTVAKVINGYTGGSMAALGVCMLLIGGVLGLVAAFYLWRRRGAGGAFAYQVYE